MRTLLLLNNTPKPAGAVALHERLIALGVLIQPLLKKAECAHAREDWRRRAPSEITLSGSCRLHSTLAAAPVLFARAVVTETKIETSITPHSIPERERLQRSDCWCCIVRYRFHHALYSATAMSTPANRPADTPSVTRVSVFRTTTPPIMRCCGSTMPA